MRLERRWTAAAELIAHARDVLDARPAGGAPPAALDARGWTSFLLGLSDEELDQLEIEGLAAEWPSGAPPSLRELVRSAGDVCAVPTLSSCAPERALRKLETRRKSAQIEAFAPLLLPLAASAGRIVDVGSGHGHLTRAIAERIARPVVGLERDPRLASRARTLGGRASFAELDVLEGGLPIDSGDCVIGLHACGELGDAIVVEAARHRASVAFVGCCLQKRRGETRAPLCGAEPTLPTRLLGLSNLTAREEGVEATRTENLHARERRLALHRLLSARLGPLRFGAEIDGLNRRTAHEPLETLVSRAFARRGLALPTADELEVTAQWARETHARVRRLSLPRNLLARVLEVFVLVDRARHLEQRGYAVEIGTVFPADASARNLGLFGTPAR